MALREYPEDEIEADPSVDCTTYLDFYGPFVYEAFNDAQALGKQPDAFGKWIMFKQLLRALWCEIAEKKCGENTMNIFRRLCIDTVSQMRGLVPSPIERIPSKDSTPVILRGTSDANDRASGGAAVLYLAARSTPMALNLGRETLPFMAALMQDRARDLFIQAGRSPTDGPKFKLEYVGQVCAIPILGDDTDMDLRFATQPPGDTKIGSGDFSLSLDRLRQLTAATTRSVLVVDRTAEPLDAFTIPGRTFSEKSQAFRADKQAYLLRGERVAVVGPVYVVFDAAFEPQRVEGNPIWCVSVMAPNLSTSDGDDRMTFVKESKDASALHDDARIEPLRLRIRRIWLHVLHLFKQKGVEYAVFNAIGCGVFKGKDAKEVRDLPTLYAWELCDLLCSERFRGAFKGIVLSLPRFTDSDDRNYTQFEAVFRGHADHLGAPVLISGSQSMIDLADRIARDNPGSTVGFVNPSDVMAVLGGCLGMFCEGGRGTIALEELIGLQTTLRAGHAGINPRPWNGAADGCVFTYAE